jgi:hypothetical protein
MANLAVQALAQEVNAIAKFESDLHNLLVLLNKEDVNVMAPGTALKIYKTSGSLSTSVVAEKALIPDSAITTDNGSLVELTFGKYRNLVSIEKIAKQGYDVAVGASTASMVKQAQAKARASIVSGMDVTGVVTAEAATFQAKIAKAAGKIAAAFEDEAYTPIFFVNPEDAFDYLGTANITVQTAFGISYIANFMGLGNVVLDSNVTAGTVFGTACENLDVVAADVTKIEGMELQTDESGIIAIHVGAKYENGAIETVVYSGLKALPVFADRVVKVTTAA